MKFELTKEEKTVFAKLSTPPKVQDFLDRLPINFGETHWSPRKVLQKKKAHCFEAATFAAVALWYHGHKPWLLDLKTNGSDYDHVVAVFKHKGYFGAISKTNHNVLRYREPVYTSVRELAMSYFHEYFAPDRKKIMKSYSALFILEKFGTAWITSDQDLEWIAKSLDQAKHYPIGPKGAKFRKADMIEKQAGQLREW